MNESEFMDQIVGDKGIATMLGYLHVHFRPARTAHGWATPVSGPLGKGWPDLVLAKPGRLIFAELKSDTGKASPEQDDVLGALTVAGAEAYIWRPKDIDLIVEILRSASRPGRLGTGLAALDGSGAAGGGSKDRGAIRKPV